MNGLVVSAAQEERRRRDAKDFVQEFLDPAVNKPKLLFGRNVYARDLVRAIRIDAVVDDYSTDDFYDDVPIIKSEMIPRDALVLAVSGGRPLTVKDKLDAMAVRNLDYFAFQKNCGSHDVVRPIVFNEGFEEDFAKNIGAYSWVDSALADEESRSIFRKLISFRLKGDIELLRGFTSCESSQYFEDFVELRKNGEVFYDIGCFDGGTSLEFAKRYPGYHWIHAFEPEAQNLRLCSDNLRRLDRLTLHNVGLSSESGNLRICSAGSMSAIGATGSEVIEVVTLDSLDVERPTFLKMDIEGAELNAIKGAASLIVRSMPKMAIAVYHYSNGCAPFWQVPKAVFAIRDDYEIRIRHYTESIYETVMFFLPWNAH